MVEEGHTSIAFLAVLGTFVDIGLANLASEIEIIRVELNAVYYVRNLFTYFFSRSSLSWYTLGSVGSVIVQI